MSIFSDNNGNILHLIPLLRVNKGLRTFCGLLSMHVAADNSKLYHRYAVMRRPLEEPPRKIGVRLRINRNRTTTVLNIYRISISLKRLCTVFDTLYFSFF